MASFEHRLPKETTEAELLSLVQRLNTDPAVHGILVQLPLPGHLDEEAILSAIDLKKDVDGFHPYNIGRLALRIPALQPCTPFGVMRLLDSIGETYKGKNAVIVGASNIVGRPMALELMLAGATVTVCHRFTKDTPEHVGRADIVVVAVGKPGLVKGEWIKPGACVIDVGVNRVGEKISEKTGKKIAVLKGDVDFDAAKEIAGSITPVPGGVGPMTITMLMKNTLKSLKFKLGLM